MSSEIPYTKEIKPGLKGKFRTILLEFKEKKQRGGEQTAALSSGNQKREVGVEQEQVILSRLEAKLSSRRSSESP